MIRSAVFSDDETKILVSFASLEEGTTTLVIDTKTGNQLSPALHHDAIVTAIFSNQNDKILTSSTDRTVRLIDAITGKELIPPMAS